MTAKLQYIRQIAQIIKANAKTNRDCTAWKKMFYDAVHEYINDTYPQCQSYRFDNIIIDENNEYYKGIILFSELSLNGRVLEYIRLI